MAFNFWDHFFGLPVNRHISHQQGAHATGSSFFEVLWTFACYILFGSSKPGRALGARMFGHVPVSVPKKDAIKQVLPVPRKVLPAQVSTTPFAVVAVTGGHLDSPNPTACGG